MNGISLQSDWFTVIPSCADPLCTSASVQVFDSVDGARTARMCLRRSARWSVTIHMHPAQENTMEKKNFLTTFFCHIYVAKLGLPVLVGFSLRCSA